MSKNIKLEWELVPPEKQMTWEEAKHYELSVQACEWRLPTLAELFGAQSGKVEQFTSGLYLSSSEDSSNTQKAWAYNFGKDKQYKLDKTKKCNVRCVREAYE